MQGLLAGAVIHGTSSLLVGLLYAAMLPMFPQEADPDGGLYCAAGLDRPAHASLGIISPILDQRIDWLWFALSQILFGLVAGFVINLQVKLRSEEFRALPFSVRAGLHVDSRFDEDKTNLNDKKDGPA